MQGVFVPARTFDSIGVVVSPPPAPRLQDKLRSLAEADGLLVVKQVQEFFADFYAVNPDMFTLNLPGSTSLSRAR